MPVPRLSPAARRERNETVKGLLAGINEEVASLPAPAMRALAPVLAEAERELARDLQAWLARANGGDAFTAQQYRAALVQIRSALEKVRQLDPALVAALDGASQRAGRMALDHLRRELVTFSAHFEGSITPVPFLQAATIAHGERTLMRRFRASAARYADGVEEDIRKQLAVGLVRGETMQQLTDRLVRLGGPKGMVALRGVSGEPGAYSEHIAEGLFGRYRYWAHRIVRTEVVNAYNVHANAGIEEAHKLDPRIQRRWDGSIDGRICAWCRELDHTVVPVGAPFPGGIEHPPAHPQCRCAVVAWRADWTEQGPVKMPGQVPPAPAEEDPEAAMKTSRRP